MSEPTRDENAEPVSRDQILRRELGQGKIQGFTHLLIFSSLSLLLFVFFGCSDGMEREACVCDHGYERSDLCAEIIIIIITWTAGGTV